MGIREEKKEESPAGKVIKRWSIHSPKDFDFRSNIYSVGAMFATSSSKKENLNNKKKCGPEDFKVLGKLGSGSWSEVVLVERRASNVLYAMKVLNKEKIVQSGMRDLAK